MLNRRERASELFGRGARFFLCGLILFVGARRATPQAATGQLPILTNAAAIHQLHPQEADRGYPVRLQGTITYYNPDWDLLFLEDATAGIYLYPTAPVPPIRAGDAVNVEGFTSMSRKSRIVMRPRIERLGSGVLPSPRPKAVSIGQVFSGSEDSQLLEIAGCIQSVRREGGDYLVLEVGAGGKRCTVSIQHPESAQVPADLVDSRVRVVGVCIPTVNDEGRPLSATLYVNRLEDVHVLESPAGDAFGRPAVDLAKISRLAATDDSGHRIRVEGVVSHQVNPNSVFIQDSSRGIFITASTNLSVQVGDRVTAAGFLELGEYGVAVREALVRKIETGPAPAPVLLSSKDSLTDAHYGKLVRRQARVLQHNQLAESDRLSCNDGEKTLLAALKHGGKPGLPRLASETLIELTGICLMQNDGSGSPTMCRLLLRSSDDIKVLKLPPWWTRRRINIALALMAGTILLAGLWIITLRQQVLAQTVLVQDRLKREAALEEKYRELVENANDIVYATDLAGKFTSINAVGERLTGYRRDELITMSVVQILAPEYLKLTRQMMARKLAGEHPGPYEVEIISKEGRRIAIELSSRLILHHGRPIGIQGIARDIMQRKQVEEALRQSEKRLHLAMRAARMGSWSWDVPHNKLTYSDELGPIFGLPIGDSHPTYETFLEAVYPDDREKVRQAVTRTLEQRSEYEIEFRITRTDGTLRWLTNKGTVFRDPSGRPLNFTGVSIDVTERRRADEILRRSEERFSTIFRTTPVPIAISRQDDHRIVDINQGFTELFGYGRAEVIGRTAVEIGLWDKPGDRAGLVKRLEASRSVRHVQCRLRTKAGAILDTLISAEAMELSDDPCFLFITYDLTERLRLEHQLRQAQKMEAIGQLAAGIAHDFNNIMTIVQAHGSLALARGDFGTETTESLKRVMTAAERATNLTRQLLAFSRKQVMRPRVLDLNQVISTVVKMLQRLLGERISLECRYAPRLPAIHADSSMLEQIVINLAVNARDAMPKGGELVISTSTVEFDDASVRGHAEAEAGLFVCLSVLDTGCGMDSVTLGKIFEPFFTTKQAGKGTGLGLAMVYGIMKQHQGWIEVTSERGRGTTFRLYFPSDPRPVEPPAPATADAAVESGTETILVVEDEAALRHVISSFLVRQGYFVLEACSGREAFDLWRTHRNEIHLLLTDLVMPGGISGFELAEQLQSEKADLKVIFTSGYAMEGVPPNVVLEDGVNFLPKPYYPPQLAQMVRDALDNVSAADQTSDG